MLRKVVMTVPVVISVKSVDKNKEVLASFIVNRLLKQLSNAKAFKHGYLLAVTDLISIGPGDNTFSSEYIVFPVNCCCRTFTPVDGEIMTGIVHKICHRGVFLKSGPMEIVYLSNTFMPNYHYVLGEKPAFVREDSSRIEIGVVVRYVIRAVRWQQDQYRQFRVLACITADGLGPVSLNGLDGMDL